MNAGRASILCVRVAAILLLTWLVSNNENPLVRLEAWLGLSPSPLEKLFGIKGLFSGMTEEMFRLAHGEFWGSLQSNALTPLAALAIIACIVTGYRPRVGTGREEALFFGAVILLSVIVNLVN